MERFPAMTLARRAGEMGGHAIGVERGERGGGGGVLNRKINFPQITEIVRRTMEAHKTVSHPTLEQILEADAGRKRKRRNKRLFSQRFEASTVQFILLLGVMIWISNHTPNFIRRLVRPIESDNKIACSVTVRISSTRGLPFGAGAMPTI